MAPRPSQKRLEACRRAVMRTRMFRRGKARFMAGELVLRRRPVRNQGFPVGTGEPRGGEGVGEEARAMNMISCDSHR